MSKSATKALYFYFNCFKLNNSQRTRISVKIHLCARNNKVFLLPGLHQTILALKSNFPFFIYR